VRKYFEGGAWTDFFKTREQSPYIQGPREKPEGGNITASGDETRAKRSITVHLEIPTYFGEKSIDGQEGREFLVRRLRKT